MTPINTLYALIPLFNCIGNILLKLSLEKKTAGNQGSFLLMQFLGYGAFVITVVFSYAFLIVNNASLMVIIFSLNYLTTLYASRWFFKEQYAVRDITYDMVIVIGIGIFYFGNMP